MNSLTKMKKERLYVTPHYMNNVIIMANVYNHYQCTNRKLCTVPSSAFVTAYSIFALEICEKKQRVFFLDKCQTQKRIMYL